MTRDTFLCRLNVLLFALAVTSVALFGCGEKEEMIEQYAKNPIGCESKSAQWYAEKVKTKASQGELRNRIRSYQLCADHHGKQVEFMSLTAAEKSEQVNKSLQCLREVIWATETLQKAGLASN